MLLSVLVLPATAAVATTWYVRVGGSDANAGTTPQAALASIRDAVRRAQAGDRVVVGPGTYFEGDIAPSRFGFAIIADRQGSEVGEAPGDVVLDATGHAAAFELNRNAGVTIDGFVIYGAGNGIYVKSSSDRSVVSNNVVCNNLKNGVYVQDSQNVVVFNNLVYNNGASGILVTGNDRGSAGAQVINNTVYGNGNRGIFFSGTTIGSPGGVVANNVLLNNALLRGAIGIQVNEVSRPGYVGFSNINADNYGDGTPIDPTDIQADPQFIEPAGADSLLGGRGYADDNFRLSQVRSGQTADSVAVDAGSDRAVVMRLNRGSTRSDGRGDAGMVDAGFHYDNNAPPPTRIRAPFRPLFVSAEHGDDANDGTSEARALRTVARALDLAQPGTQVRLLGGTYREGNLEFRRSGRPERNIVLLGTLGARIDASGFRDGIYLANKNHIQLVGIQVFGAARYGVHVRTKSTGIVLSGCRLSGNGSRGLYVYQAGEVTVQDCTIDGNFSTGVQVLGGGFVIEDSVVAGNRGNGIQLDRTIALVSGTLAYSNRSNGILIYDAVGPVLYNNLIYANGGSGIVVRANISGTRDVQIVNNTVYANANRGLLIGSSNVRAESVGTTVLRNIIEGNALGGIQVNPKALSGYVGDYNLTTDRYVGAPVGRHDRIASALFVAPAGADGVLGGESAADDLFQLSQTEAGQSVTSPAVDAGGIDSVSAGFQLRTTRTDGVGDAGVVDLGFHYRR